MKKIIYILFFMPLFCFGQTPVKVNNPHIFNKYVKTNDSLVSKNIAFVNGTLPATISRPTFAAINDTIFYRKNNADTWKYVATSEQLAAKQDTFSFTEFDNKYLANDGQFKTIEPPAGGYANNLYLDTLTSVVVPTYKTLTYNVSAYTNSQTLIVNSGEGDKLIATYLYPTGVTITNFPSGLWSFSFHGSISSATGVTKIGVQYFARTVGGVETTLFTLWSDEVNNTSDDWIKFSMSQPSYVVNITDRMGLRLLAKTTSGTNKTITIAIGDGYGAYLNNPNRIRHSQLRDLNGDTAYLHVRSQDTARWNNAGKDTYASNGLTKDGDTVKLGGSVNTNVTLSYTNNEDKYFLIDIINSIYSGGLFLGKTGFQLYRQNATTNGIIGISGTNSDLYNPYMFYEENDNSVEVKLDTSGLHYFFEGGSPPPYSTDTLWIPHKGYVDYKSSQAARTAGDAGIGYVKYNGITPLTNGFYTPSGSVYLYFGGNYYVTGETRTAGIYSTQAIGAVVNGSFPVQAVNSGTSNGALLARLTDISNTGSIAEFQTGASTIKAKIDYTGKGTFNGGVNAGIATTSQHFKFQNNSNWGDAALFENISAGSGAGLTVTNNSGTGSGLVVNNYCTAASGIGLYINNQGNKGLQIVNVGTGLAMSIDSASVNKLTIKNTGEITTLSDINYKPPHISTFVEDVTYNLTLTTVNVYYKIAPTFPRSGSNIDTSGVTFQGDTLTIRKAGDYEVYLTFTQTGGTNNEEYKVAVFKNNAKQYGIRRTWTTGNVTGGALIFYLKDLAVNDNISFRVANLTNNTDTWTATNINLLFKKAH